MIKAIIEDGLCFKCGFCMLFDLCPDNNAIKRDDNNIELAKTFYIDSDKCSGCLSCVDINPCNAFAIKLENNRVIRTLQKFSLQSLPGVVPIIKKESSLIKANNSKIKYITNEELPGVGFDFNLINSKSREVNFSKEKIKVLLAWGGGFELWAEDQISLQKVKSEGEQIFAYIPPFCNYGIYHLGDMPVNLVEVSISLQSVDGAEEVPQITRPLFRRQSNILFEDGPISKYGKYITKQELPNLDFQYLDMKINTEDAHVHDKEVEIMLLWGGMFEVWTKGPTGTQFLKSNGEQTCIMIPPGYAHGVKVTGDEEVHIVITYIPGIDSWP